MTNSSWRASHVFIVLGLVSIFVLAYFKLLESRWGGIALLIYGVATFFASIREFGTGEMPARSLSFKRSENPWGFWFATARLFGAAFVFTLLGLLILTGHF